MQRFILAIGVGLAFVIGAASAPAPEPPPPDRERQELELRAQQLELQNRESEIKFEAEIRNLELEKRRIELMRQRNSAAEAGRKDEAGRAQKFGWTAGRHAARKGCMAVFGLIHLLMAIWVYADIRRRNSGSGLWIIITLLAGFFGIVPYLLARLGDARQP